MRLIMSADGSILKLQAPGLDCESRSGLRRSSHVYSIKQLNRWNKPGWMAALSYCGLTKDLGSRALCIIFI